MTPRSRRSPGRSSAAAAIAVAILFAGTACSSDEAAETGGTSEPSADPASSTGGSSSPPASSDPTAGPETGDLAMVGRLTRDGEPVAGAEVFVMIWPDDLASLEDGEQVETQQVADDVTDRSGAFRLSIDPDTITSAYMPADQDFLNVDIMAADDSFFGQTSNTIWRIDDEVWRGSEQARVGDPVMGLEIDLTAEQVRVRERDGEVSRQGFPVQPTG